MTNNSDKMRIFLSVVFLLLLLIFELIHQAALVNFIVFKHFENLILNILKEKLRIPWPEGSLFMKTVQNF